MQGHDELTCVECDLTAVSLFSGAGGFDLGIEAVGFSTLFATDNDSSCCETLRTNKAKAAELGLPFLQTAKIVQRCIRELSAEEILSDIGKQPGEVDLLIGGPPCQTFSVIGRRNGKNDPRGELVDEYLRILAGIQPRAFLFENVKGLRTIDDGKVYNELLCQMRKPADGLRYEVSPFCLNAADFGVPQNRERIFIVGSSTGATIVSIPNIREQFGSRLNGSCERRTVADAFRGLPKAESTYPANHHGRKHSTRISERYAMLKPGERDLKTRINKLDETRPGYTIVSGSPDSGGKGHIHPVEPREVTPRESARIQTFPDWWEFKGTSVSDARRQIGNAVPPLLAAAISNEVRHRLLQLMRIDFSAIVSSLDQDHLGFE